MNSYNHKCELCGTPVKSVGTVTNSYESAYEALKRENQELKDEINGLKDELKSIRELREAQVYLYEKKLDKSKELINEAIDALEQANSFNEYMLNHYMSLNYDWKNTKYAAEHFKCLHSLSKSIIRIRAEMEGK